MQMMVMIMVSGDLLAAQQIQNVVIASLVDVGHRNQISARISHRIPAAFAGEATSSIVVWATAAKHEDGHA